MNSKAEWKTTARLSGAAPDSRRLEWLEIFGGGVAPIVSMMPAMARLPIGEEFTYDLDTNALSDEQFERLVNFVGSKFDEFDRDNIAHVLKTEGMAIPAHEVSVNTSDQGMFF